MSVFINNPNGRGGGHFANVVHEDNKPEKSKLLGPDGKPMTYEKSRIGFDLTPKKAEETL